MAACDDAPTTLAENLRGIMARATTKRLREGSEAALRVEVVDEVLKALGWRHEDIQRESPSGTGGFLDYQLNVGTSPWLVVEAKRVGKTFELSDPAPRHRTHSTRNLSGLLARGGNELREVLNQCARYCNDRGTPLACATNGLQWLFFRGLSAPARPWNQGQAVVFDGADDILARLDDFSACLGRSWAGTSYLPSLLDRALPAQYPPATRPRERLVAQRSLGDARALALVHSVTDYLLSDIYGQERAGMLDHCYVQPGISAEFERSLQRLLKDNTRAVEIEQPVLEGGPDSLLEQVTLEERLSPVPNPILVVGHVGAGKTTFLHKSLATLREGRSAFFALVNLEGHGTAGVIDSAQEEERVARLILEKLKVASTTVLKSRGDLSEGARRQADPSDPSTLRTIYRKRIDEERRLGGRLWTTDPSAWNRKEYEILEAARTDTRTLLVHFIRHLRARYRRLDDQQTRYPIVIVLDNLDLATDAYQRCIYAFARRLASETPAVVVLCLREDTYLEGRQPGGFLTSSPLQFVFHVATPPLDQLVRRRVEFGDRAIEERSLPTRLISESAEIQRICAVLRKVMLAPRAEALELVAGLAGHNARHALEIIGSILLGATSIAVRATSSAAFAFECLLAASSGSESMSTRLGIANCFDAEPSVPPFHELRTRLLAYYSWCFDNERDRTLSEGTERVLARFGVWGYPIDAVASAIQGLLTAGLLVGVERSTGSTRRDLPARACLTASGLVHLRRLIALPTYRAAMATVTRWYDPLAAETFVERAAAAGGPDGPTIADIEASTALSVFDAYLAKAQARENAHLVAQLGAASWVGEVLSRSHGFLPGAEAVASTEQPGAPQPERRKWDQAAAGENAQLGIPGMGPAPRLQQVALPCLRRDLKYGNTVWIPRLLWALEWGRLSGTRGMSPSDIAVTLGRHADVDVPNTNVARALRDLKLNPNATGLWSIHGRRYSITAAGSTLLKAILAEEPDSGDPLERMA